MRKNKNQAIRLRKEGKSYNKISIKLQIPKSTLSDWLRNTRWSQKIAKRLSNEANAYHSVRMQELGKIKKGKLAELYEQAKVEACEEFSKLKFNPLFITALALYWGEGEKSTHHTTRLGNVDPVMIKVFYNFLTKICGAPTNKVKAYVLLYPDLEDDNCKNYWSRNTGIGLQNFAKSIRIVGKHKKRRLSYGVCTIYYSSTYFKAKMLKWLNLFTDDILQY